MGRTGKEAILLLTNSSKRPQRRSLNTLLCCGLSCVLAVTFSTTTLAGPREQAKRIHDLLTGIPPSTQLIDEMETAIGDNAFPPIANLIAAANIVLTDIDAIDAKKAFYNVTLKNFATPWTNEAQTVFAPLNDYSATVIGIIRDDVDFRKILYEDVVYTGSNINDYSHSNNNLYENLENSNADLSDPTILVARTQSELSGSQLLPNDTAGVMTTRAAARAFFVDGTNRAMFRFTILNHLCTDLEQLKDSTRPADRIRQDVSRSPGGDSRLFLNNCMACHTGMDPMTQAFARYEWAYTTDVDAGQLEYSTEIQPKYHINSGNFKGGYITKTEDWTNYWRRGSNVWLDWADNSPPTVTSGTGAKSLGEELANSGAFARCQVKKVFKAVCMRDPQQVDLGRNDTAAFNTMVANFQSNYQLKGVFTEAAAYCSGPSTPQ